ncbi:MAG: hypothetical protein ACOYJS_07865 [Acutalibacteraceae bacterium]
MEIIEIHRHKITNYRTQLLLDSRIPQIIKEEEPTVYKQLTDRYGVHAVSIAEKQLTLYFINNNWAAYLAAMEDIQNGIHLVIVGGKSPINEYKKFAVNAFNEMMLDIRRDVVSYMQKCVITENGIDMEKRD